MWTSSDLLEGLVSKALRVDTAEGAFVFSMDPLFTALLVWDAATSTGYLLTTFAVFFLARRLARVLLASPLSAILGALTSAASILDREGRIKDSASAVSGGEESGGRSGREQPRRQAAAGPSASGRQVAPLEEAAQSRAHLGATISSILKLLARVARGDGICHETTAVATATGKSPRPSHDQTTHGPEGSHETREGGSHRRSHERRLSSDRQGSKGDDVGEGDMRRLSMRSTSSLGSRTSHGGSRGARGIWTDSGALKMHFSETVLNWIASPGQPDCLLQPDDYVPAAHLIWIKARVPETVCDRKTFVTWSQHILTRHTELPFHNPRRDSLPDSPPLLHRPTCTGTARSRTRRGVGARRRAVACMQAAFRLVREHEFDHLEPLRVMALLVAALSVDVASVGMEDRELCDTGHPIALRYSFMSPRLQAAMAVTLEVAHMVPGANIFGKLARSAQNTLRGALKGVPERD